MQPRSGPRSFAAMACAISDVDKLASWWHTDADLGRTVETFTDMGEADDSGSRVSGQPRRPSRDLFERLRSERIVP